MLKKTKYKIILILPLILCLTLLGLLFYLFIEEITATFQIYEEAYLLTLITIIKILIVLLMGIYLINKWFKQQEIYFSDILFLIGSVFLVLIIGKLFDFLLYFINIQISSELLLFFAKIRYIIIIINLLPMIYLSLEMILFYLSVAKPQSSLKEKNKREGIKKKSIIIITIIELSIVLIAPTYKALFYILPFLIIPSLIMIVWVFAFAYKNEKLTEINTLTVSIGWALYLSTTIFRSLGQNIVDLPIFLSISEILEIISFLVIFIGFMKKKV
ncbi:MAG: hypothetical protein EU547_07515 [Promethearchaeota archaeon]|nr:MAG: hypothetical protein EU547_07515 [Candidatus Lokiarchaeota archaeon]